MRAQLGERTAARKFETQIETPLRLALIRALRRIGAMKANLAAWSGVLLFASVACGSANHAIRHAWMLGVPLILPTTSADGAGAPVQTTAD